MTVDWTKPIQTRSGLPARVICTDRKTTTSNWSVVVLINNQYQEWPACYPPDGGGSAARIPEVDDIINVPEKIKIDTWIPLNFYGVQIHLTGEVEAGTDVIEVRIP